MELYDVLVVGAGPGGGLCARELSAQGKKVLLIEKAKSFLDNNFSSGGAPIELMNEFSLPSSIVGTYWNTLKVLTTHSEVAWNSSKPMGPIIDFEKLRSYLADETVKNGGTFCLGLQYVSHIYDKNAYLVKLKDSQKELTKFVKAKVLVDATGTERKVLKQPNTKENKLMAVTGMEYHVEVLPEIYDQFANSMNFYLGHKWMPQGYAWIFSMAPNMLKIGIVRYFQNKMIVPHELSYKPYLENILSLCGSQEQYKIVNRHGKTINYRLGQNDKRYENRVIAIGDAVSAINPLGCEGIRHAMVSGRYAAQEIINYLDGKTSSFKGYQTSLNKYFGMKWFCSEMMMRSLFLNKKDALIDQTIAQFHRMDNEEILDVIFNYRFSRAFKSYFWYFMTRFKNFAFSQKTNTVGMK